MKYRPNRTQITWGITAFLTLVACVIFIYLVYNGRTFLQAFQTIMNSLQPILYGIVIAFILNPVMSFVEKRMLAPVYRRSGVDIWAAQSRKKRMQMRRISVSITIAFFIALLAAMLAIVLPQLTRSIQTIFSNLTVYERNVLSFFDQVSKGNPDLGEQINSVVINTENFLENFYQKYIAANLTDILQRAASQAYLIGKGMFNFIIGIIVSIYLMYTKDTLSGQGRRSPTPFLMRNGATRWWEPAVISTAPSWDFSQGKFWIPSSSASFALSRRNSSRIRPFRCWHRSSSASRM